MDRDTILRLSDDVVAREVGGEMVLMHLESGTYFGLNAVGMRIWQLLAESEQAVAAICAAIAGEFDADPTEIEADVIALAGELIAHELVTANATQSG